MAFELLCAGGTLLASTALYVGGADAYEFFYFWVALYAAYFFGHSGWMIQLGLVLACYAVVEYAAPAGSPSPVRLLIASGALIVAATTVALLKARLVAVIDRLEAVLEASPLAVVELDSRGQVRGWSAGAERLFGWSRDEVAGQRLPMAAAGKSVGHLFERVMADAPLNGHELDCSRKNESPVSTALYTAPLAGDGFHAGGRLLLAADVSARTKLEERLTRAAKMEVMGRLASGIAHDFGNLVLIIRTHASLAKDRVGPAVETEVAAIEQACGDATRILRELLAFGRHETLEPAILDLDDLLASVAAMIDPLLDGGLELTHTRSDRPATVLADRTQLELIVLNLALNARDAQPDGGTIRLETHAGEHAVELRVTDTGSGMDESTLARVFDPFFSTKDDEHGTGLGLSIVHDLVVGNGGQIDVESEPGVGTTFSVVLPLAARPAVLTAPAPEELLTADHGLETVLLVEDDPEVRESLGLALEHYGYRILSASGPAEALELAAYETIDVAVTDVEADPGDELASRLGGIPVVYIAGHEDAAPISAPDTCLVRPFTPIHLARAIRAALRDPGSAGRAAVRTSQTAVRTLEVAQVAG